MLNVWGRRGMYICNIGGKDRRKKNLDVGGRIILKWISERI
jgi:hypothetical protein